MKNYSEFLVEGDGSIKITTIEQLADICRKAVAEISKKIDVPLGLVQQGIVLMEMPYPHIHCQKNIIKNGLTKDNEFIADEVCGVFQKMAEEHGLETTVVKKGGSHGSPEDVLARIKF
jgi:hypothetical protein